MRLHHYSHISNVRLAKVVRTATTMALDERLPMHAAKLKTRENRLKPTGWREEAAAMADMSTSKSRSNTPDGDRKMKK